MKSFSNPIILEAKRIILQEQLEKAANQALVNIDLNKQYVNIEKLEDIKAEEAHHDFEVVVTNTKANNELKNVYFNQWKKYTNKQKAIKDDPSSNQRQKVERFIETLKEYKYKKTHVSIKDVESKPIIEKPPFLRQSSLHVCPTQPKEEVKKRNVKTTNNNGYKNRFEAQKNIIVMQKNKLKEQEKLIEQLKLGMVSKELYKSINNAEQNIKEIFQFASTKVKSKVNPIVSVGCKEKLFELELYSHKAPKFVQEMEKRAQEREIRRELIMERKREIDEYRKRIKEQAIEAKRAQDEEETKKNLEAMKEKRRKELEIQKKKQLIRLKFEQQYRMAENFYNKQLKSRYFTTWILAVIQMHLWEERCHKKYLKSILKKSFNRWLNFYNSLEDQFLLADYLYKKITLQRTFSCWRLEITNSKHCLQTAEDFYNMQLEHKVFKHWYRYVCTQYIIQVKNNRKSEEHYKRRILFQFFYQWKSLPAVLQLERAKEEKKKKWRERVWEILPDYQRPTD